MFIYFFSLESLHTKKYLFSKKKKLKLYQQGNAVFQFKIWIWRNYFQLQMYMYASWNFHILSIFILSLPKEFLKIQKSGQLPPPCSASFFFFFGGRVFERNWVSWTFHINRHVVPCLWWEHYQDRLDRTLIIMLLYWEYVAKSIDQVPNYDPCMLESLVADYLVTSNALTTLWSMKICQNLAPDNKMKRIPITVCMMLISMLIFKATISYSWIFHFQNKKCSLTCTSSSNPLPDSPPTTIILFSMTAAAC